MKIKFLGFKWNLLCHEIQLPNFCFHLQQDGKNRIQTVTEKLTLKTHSDMPTPIIVLIEQSDWWTGASIKIKDIRAFCKMIEENGDVKLTTEKLKGNETAVEVNFFVLNKNTGCGLYQYYHQSIWLDTFNKHCRGQYDSLVRKRREDLVQRDAKKSEIAKFNKSKTLTYEIMATKERLPELVRSLESVKRLEIVAAEHLIKEGAFTPLAGRVSRVRHSFIIGKKNGRSLVESIAAALEKSLLKKAKVVGMIPGNLDVVYKLEDNYQSFGEIDHDKATDGNLLEIDIGNIDESLKKSGMLKMMLDVVKNQKHKKMFAGQ